MIYGRRTIMFGNTNMLWWDFEFLSWGGGHALTNSNILSHIFVLLKLQLQRFRQNFWHTDLAWLSYTALLMNCTSVSVHLQCRTWHQPGLRRALENERFLTKTKTKLICTPLYNGCFWQLTSVEVSKKKKKKEKKSYCLAQYVKQNSSLIFSHFNTIDTT